jgi:hypothetical protein
MGLTLRFASIEPEKTDKKAQKTAKKTTKRANADALSRRLIFFPFPVTLALWR